MYTRNAFTPIVCYACSQCDRNNKSIVNKPIAGVREELGSSLSQCLPLSLPLSLCVYVCLSLSPLSLPPPPSLSPCLSLFPSLLSVSLSSLSLRILGSSVFLG